VVAWGRIAVGVMMALAAAGCSPADSPAAVGAIVDRPDTTVTTVAAAQPAVPVTTPGSTGVPATAPPPATTPPDVDLDLVAVVGDSLTLSAADLIEADLLRIGVDRVVIDARESRRMVVGSSGIPAGRSAIDAILDDADPDLWVVALGTNDISAGAGSDEFRSDVDAILGSLPDDVPVVWVDLWIRDRRADVVEANLALRDVLGGRMAPAVTAEWYSAAAAPGNVIGDGVHLTDAGRERFASEISSAVVELVLAAAGV
jgi:lysophospholipase L1-like esterase